MSITAQFCLRSSCDRLHHAWCVSERGAAVICVPQDEERVGFDPFRPHAPTVGVIGGKDRFHWAAKGELQKGNTFTIKSLKSDLKVTYK